MEKLYYCHIKHPLVNLTLFVELLPKGDVKLVEVKFGIFKSYNNRIVEQSKNRISKKIADTIIDFLDGKVENLSVIKINLEGYTDFQKRVLKAARSIPRGKTVSYSELAKMSGSPKAVRAVASVMRNNRLPLVIPCHRVIKKGGAIGGFSGQMRGPKVNLKKKLIESERLTA